MTKKYIRQFWVFPFNVVALILLVPGVPLALVGITLCGAAGFIMDLVDITSLEEP